MNLNDGWLDQIQDDEEDYGPGCECKVICAMGPGPTCPERHTRESQHATVSHMRAVSK